MAGRKPEQDVPLSVVWITDNHDQAQLLALPITPVDPVTLYIQLFPASTEAMGSLPHPSSHFLWARA